MLMLEGLTFTFNAADSLQENPTFQYVSVGGAKNIIIGFNVDDVDTQYERPLKLNTKMPISQPPIPRVGTVK